MKKFSVLAAFLFVVMISSTAFAANWVKVFSDEDEDTYVDTNSARRGIYSDRLGIYRSDGFTVNVRHIYADDSDTAIWVIGFFTENGKRAYINYLDVLDENGNSLLVDHSRRDYSVDYIFDGTPLSAVYDYVENHLL